MTKPVSPALAARRANRLFRRLMTPAQRRTWDRHGYCAQPGCNGRTYLIIKRNTYRGLILVLPNGEARWLNMSVFVMDPDGGDCLPPRGDQRATYLLHARHDQGAALTNTCWRPLWHGKETKTVSHFQRRRTA